MVNHCSCVCSTVQDSSLTYHIEMYESTPFVELMFQATVPITCPGCSLTLPVTHHVGLTVSSCSLTFTSADTNSTYKTLYIRAVQTAGSNARILQLTFGSIVADGSPWDGYALQEMRVYCIYVYDPKASIMLLLRMTSVNFQRLSYVH